MQAEFETQQQKLQRLSGDVLARYQREIDTEVADPQRLEATYGAVFASAGMKRQAQTVCLMATQMLGVPNAAISVLGRHEQEFIARVEQGQVVQDSLVTRIEDSYCRQVIGTGREFAVEKAAEHPLVCDSTFTTDGIIVSYLGVPIADRNSIIVGVLCTWDSVEHPWSAADVAVLTQLSLVLTRAAASSRDGG